MMNQLIDTYLSNIDKKGLEKTWSKILKDSLNGSSNYDVNDFGELYEIGLEHTNKISKKEMGKYYTPEDVANILSNWLLPLAGKNICDVGCGTGNLILNYLDKLEPEKRLSLINNKNIYLYDMDPLALKICKYSIAIKYGSSLLNKINTVKGDFLDKKIKLPKNSKVISNPPYYKITEIKSSWKISDVIKDSKEYYSSFMEKIISQSESSVIITPYSFIGSNKFYSLREHMNKYNGFIVSFDNVPGNIFNGRKHGIFNSNSTNSVRAAITVTENRKDKLGYRVSPLIRFKTEERKKLLNNNVLYKLIDKEYQLVSDSNKAYHKCFIELGKVYKSWIQKSNKTLEDYLSNKNNNGRLLCIPTTCRYFTVGSSVDLSRDGKRIFYLKNNEDFDLVYAFINSSFVYWWWRLIDGGINCSISLIYSIPVFFESLSDKDKIEIHNIVNEMINKEKNFFVYKMNAGKKQESIKFPREYRDKINNIFLKALSIDDNYSIFNIIHSSSIFGESEVEDNE